MKVAILAGGLGTRLSEETTIKPKPMVEIGGHPMLWHIMKMYAAYGFKEFVIALGYKGEIIKDYFLNYQAHSRNLTVDLKTGEVSVHDGGGEDWIVHLLDTGHDTNTGGRVKRVAEFIRDETFMLTYGDGVSDIDIPRLLEFHRLHGKLATVTAVRPPGRFGSIVLEGERITHFAEKPQVGEGWINGGFFVLEPKVAEYITDDQTLWEANPMEKLVRDDQMVAYRHGAFWMCMDTLRDVKMLDNMWQEGKAPWKVW